MFKNSLDYEKQNSYMNIQDNYLLEKSGENKVLNYDYDIYKPISPKLNNSNEFVRYKTMQTENSHDEVNILKSKLETKKLRLREMKSQFENVCEENATLKLKLAEIGRKSVGGLRDERELLEIIRHLEEEKLRSEDKLAKMQTLDNLKNQEIELMNQKIRDFELILDENQNEHVESIKSMKLELEQLKMQQNEGEKLCDILNYFFKKIRSYYPKNKKEPPFNQQNNPSNSSSQSQSQSQSQLSIEENIYNKNHKSFDIKLLQNKLIELENFLIKILNDKTALSQKFSKILDIQSKITQSESMENSQFQIENIKKLNEKIYDLTDENKYLKSLLENNKTESINVSRGEELPKDKENIFRNNFTKENKDPHNEESLLHIADKSVITTHNNINSTDLKNNLGDNLRTLEQRVVELEKELKKKNSYNMRPNPSITNISHLSNVSKSRSKSNVKKVNFLPIDSKKSFDNRNRNNLGVLKVINTVNKPLNVKEKKKKNKSEEIKKIKKKSKVASNSTCSVSNLDKADKHNSRSHSFLNKKVY